MNSIRRIAVVLVLAVLLASPSFAAPKDAAGLPGFVDGTAFADLAGEEDEIVEVNLGPSMLSALARGAAQDREASSILTGLTSVTAYVLTMKGDGGRFQKALDLVRDTESRLEKAGWERLARVRDGKERVNIFALNGKAAMEGLTVLVVDAEAGEVVFLNLAGTIDLARLGDLEGTLDIPGLEAVKAAE